MSARDRILDARALGETQVTALDHRLGAQLARDDAASVVGVVADFGVALVAGAHVGADTAVVEQGHVGAQDGLDEAVAVEHLGGARTRAAGLRAERDALAATAKNAAAGTDQRWAVVGSLRGRQLEQRLRPAR